MKSLFKTAITLAILFVCPPIFAGAGEWRLSLDGDWQFSTNRVASTWDVLAVPGNWDTQSRYATYVGKGWYRREFTEPQEWAGKHVRLCFGAVYHDATITLNGHELGSHTGGYTPFGFDVTDQLNLGGTNVLLVCADNSFQRGAWWHWGGISRSVSLIANNEARIVWQHIRAEPDLTTGMARISVSYKLANVGATPLAVGLESSINETPDSGLVRDPIVIPANGETVVELETTLPKERVKLWDFDHPHLYSLATRLMAGGEIIHEQSDRFGIRKVEITPEGLMLNGERVRLPGFNRVSDSRETGNTEPDSLVRRDVDMMKSCGAAMSRLMHVPQAPNLLDYLDEKGMLIFEEIPVWQDDPEMKQNNPVTEEWLREMIERDYNHPCIIGWSMGNEMPKGRAGYVRSMIDFVRHTLDSSRLLTYVTCTAADRGESPKSEPIGESDVALVNDYQANFLANGKAVTGAAALTNFGGRIDTVRGRWPDKPIFLSECGVTQVGESIRATIPNWEQGWTEISRHPYVIGAALWTFNDYRSAYKGTGPSGNRTWGVVDVERHPKAAFEQVRKLFCPVHSLIVQGASVCLVPRCPEEIPSYVLRGYQIHWVARGPSGANLQSGNLDVPDLKPGDASWNCPLPAPAGTVALEVHLYTQTGYDVADGEGRL